MRPLSPGNGCRFGTIVGPSNGWEEEEWERKSETEVAGWLRIVKWLDDEIVGVEGAQGI